MSHAGGSSSGPPTWTTAQCLEAGSYYFSQGQFESASAWWSKALELEPDNVRARELLEHLHYTQHAAIASRAGAMLDPWAAPAPEAVPLSPTPYPGRSTGPAPFRPPAELERAALEASFGAAIDEEIGRGKDLPPLEAEEAFVDRAAEEAWLTGLEQGPPPEPRSVALPAAVPWDDGPLAPGDAWGGPPQSSPSPPPSGPEGFLHFDPSTGEISGEMVAPVPADGFDFDSALAAVSAPVDTPWDLGPASTSAVELDVRVFDDAVPEETAPEGLDREPLFQKPDHGPVEDFSFELGPTDYDLSIEEPVEIAPAKTIHIEGRQGSMIPGPRTSIPIAGAEALIREARMLLQLDDFDGALHLLERVERDQPHHPEAEELLLHTREALQTRYEARIGPMSGVPRQIMAPDQIIWLSLNHRAGYLLSQVDGFVTYDDLIALSGMPRLDTLRIITALLQEGVINHL